MLANRKNMKHKTLIKIKVNSEKPSLNASQIKEQ